MPASLLFVHLMIDKNKEGVMRATQSRQASSRAAAAGIFTAAARTAQILQIL
jgi:hypothetical protein